MMGSSGLVMFAYGKAIFLGAILLRSNRDAMQSYLLDPYLLEIRESDGIFSFFTECRFSDVCSTSISKEQSRTDQALSLPVTGTKKERTNNSD